jgi:hypothetical protein
MYQKSLSHYRFSMSIRFSFSFKNLSDSLYALIVLMPVRDSEKCEYKDDRKIASFIFKLDAKFEGKLTPT